MSGRQHSIDHCFGTVHRVIQVHKDFVADLGGGHSAPTSACSGHGTFDRFQVSMRALEVNPENAADEFAPGFDHGLPAGDVSRRFVFALHEPVGRTMPICQTRMRNWPRSRKNVEFNIFQDRIGRAQRGDRPKRRYQQPCRHLLHVRDQPPRISNRCSPAHRHPLDRLVPRTDTTPVEGPLLRHPDDRQHRVDRRPGSPGHLPGTRKKFPGDSELSL